MYDVIAKRYIMAPITGSSRPHILEANNNKKYVVKFANNKYGTRLLANEWICYKLAKLLSLPIPDAAKIYVPQFLIDNEPTLAKIGAPEGVHFGSKYIENSIDFSGPNILERISNKNDIPGILAFDFWIYNDDRCDNSGNLLITTYSDESKLLIIDNGNAFGGPDWTIDALDEQVEVIGLDGCVYSQLKRYIKDENLEIWLQRIENITIKQIAKCVCNIPSEWGISNNEKKLLCLKLMKRKTDVRHALNLARKIFC